MTLLKTKASCFIDACEIAFDAPAHVIAGDYRDLIGEVEHYPETEGFHPSIINQALIERFGMGVVQLDMLPVGEDHEPYSDHPTRYLAQWFKRAGFRCVVTGLRENGEAHALAFRNGVFIDPAGPTELTEPNIAVKYLWCMSVPPFTPSDGDE